MTEKKTELLKRAIIIFGVLVVATCVMIYLFSAQDATQSSLTSGKITMFISRLLFPDLDSMPDDVVFDITSDISFRVRKCAHFTEYLLLAQFTFQLLLALPRPRSDVICGLIAVVFSSCFAMTDEYHQSFVPGRAMAAKDVLIDSSGAFLGVLLVLLVRFYLRKRKKNAADVSAAESNESAETAENTET